MPRILVVYSSTHGQTAKIAARIAAALEHDGATVDLHRLASTKLRPTPLDYDAVIVGGSIHAGHHQRVLVDWVKLHRTGLDMRPSAFFTVCLTAADDTYESREATRAYLDDFVEQTGWTPRNSTTFAGSLQYREYDFATRLVMRLLMHRQHHPSDISRDYDCTDWDAVDRWSHALIATIVGRSAQW
jgi:menaquinone-dependent protoporphyrinogen oxidase